VSSGDNSIAPTRDAVLGGVEITSEARNPLLCTEVLMKASDVSTTSLLARASFRNTTFHPGFPGSSEKNTCVAWLAKMNGSDSCGNLCRKLTTRNPASSRTYVGLPLLSCLFIHSHRNKIMGECSGP
jgi:hypothetical protein